jgi:hypothetical protein
MGLKFSGKALSVRDVTGIAKLTSNRGPQHPAIEQLVVHRQCGVHLRRCLVQLVDCEQISDADAMAELPTLRAIAAAELHNLVFERDYRIVPATTRSAGRTR